MNNRALGNQVLDNRALGSRTLDCQIMDKRATDNQALDNRPWKILPAIRKHCRTRHKQNPGPTVNGKIHNMEQILLMIS